MTPITTPLRDASIRVAAFITAYSTSTREKDKGEGPVSYIAVVLLIAVIATAIAASGVGTKITGFIDQAVDKVFQNGGGSKAGS